MLEPFYVTATKVQGQFVNLAGEVIGKFDGIICVEEVRVEGHGEGEYEPPEQVGDGDVVQADRPRVYFEATAGEHNIRACVERAHIRRGIIGFRAWLSQE